MKLTDLVDYVKDDVTVGGTLKLYTPPTTIYKFIKRGLKEVTRYFPMTAVVTVLKDGVQYVDIPSENNVQDVVQVAAIESFTEEFTFTGEEIFFATTNFVDYSTDLENWIRYKRNLRAYKVLLGAEFDWDQSDQNKNRVYLDNIPTGTRAFTIKFTTDVDLPDSLPEESSEDNIDIPDPQVSYLERYGIAKLKQSEGKLLKRFRATGQAAETDGKALADEGKRELEELRKELKTDGYSLLSL